MYEKRVLSLARVMWLSLEHLKSSETARQAGGP